MILFFFIQYNFFWNPPVSYSMLLFPEITLNYNLLNSKWPPVGTRYPLTEMNIFGTDDAC